MKRSAEGPEDEVSRTLYVTQLPADSTERELYLCFCRLPGFDRALLVKRDGRKPFGFVQFHSAEAAAASLTTENGFRFDPDGSTIRVCLSRRNIPQHFVSHRSLEPDMKRARIASGLSPVSFPPMLQAGIMPPGANSTLFVCNIPPTAPPERFAMFLEQNLPGTTTGHNVTTKDGGATYQAFVGFRDPASAAIAMSRMQGFQWDGCVLEVNYARKEFDPNRSRLSGPPTPRSTQSAGGVVSTVFVQGLPASATKDEFDQWLLQKGCPEPAASLLQLAKGGTRHNAFVLFQEHEAATALSLLSEDARWVDGSPVVVQMANTNLDPNRLH